MSNTTRSGLNEGNATFIVWWVLGSVGIGLLAILTGLALVVTRALYWLKQGTWVNSLCEGATQFGLNAPACSWNSSWQGFNRLYEYAAWSMDGSLLLLVLGVLIPVVGWLIALPLMAVLALMESLDELVARRRRR